MIFLFPGGPGKCPVEQYHAVLMEDDIAGCSGFTSDTWKDIPLHASLNSNTRNLLVIVYSMVDLCLCSMLNVLWGDFRGSTQYKKVRIGKQFIWHEMRLMFSF